MPKWSSRDKQFFYHQAWTMLRAGMTLSRAAELIARHRAGNRVGETAAALARSLAEGRPLSEFMRGRPEVFSSYEAELTAAGESRDRLADSLEWLSRLYTDQAEYDGRSRVERLYLYLNIGIAVLALAVLNFLVGPVIKDIFADGYSLPIFTEWFLGLNDWFVSWGWLALAAAVLIRIALPRIWGRYHVVMSMVLTHFPWAGPRWMEAEAMRLAWVLGRGLELGASLAAALRDAAAFVSHPYLRERTRALAEQAGEGRPLAEGLAAIRMFPESVIVFAALGERRGELGAALTEVTRSRSPRSQAIPAEIVQLAIMGVMAVFVGLYALAVYLPIFTMAGGF